MIITYHNNNYFKVQSGDTVVLIDPDDQRSFRGATLIVYSKTSEISEVSKISKVSEVRSSSEAMIIRHQGEYEVHNIAVRGWSNGSQKSGVSKVSEVSEKTIYKISFDDIIVGVLGHLEDEPSKEIQEHLKGVDILIVPASGTPYLAQASVARMIRQIEPGIVIPSLFKNTSDLKVFLKELNQSPKEEEKLVIKKKEIKEKGMEVRILKS